MSSVSDEDALVKSTNKLSVNDDQSVNGVQSSDDLLPTPAAPAMPDVKIWLSPVHDGDSAYMTQSASVTSTPSSLSPASSSPSDWPHQTQTETRVQRKSWAAGQTEFHEHYQRHHLHQSESCHDIGQQDTMTTSSDMNVGELFVPSNTELGMVSVFSSARRRLGRRRDPLANNNSKSNAKSSKSPGGGETSGSELHRAPSSLFYLEYEGDEDDDDDDGLSMKTRRKYSDMSSSRKISAAAYLPRANATSTPTDDTKQHQEQQQQQQQQQADDSLNTSNEHEDTASTVAKRRRRVERPHHLAVTTIDEILKRQDSSLEKYYKDTLRQVCSHHITPTSPSVCLSVCVRSNR